MKKIIISCFALFYLSSLAIASNKFYIVSSIGQNKSNWYDLIDESIKNSSYLTNSKKSLSYGGKIGYRLNSNTAIEASLYNIQGLRKDNKTTDHFTRQTHWLANTALKYSLSKNKLAPYLAIGATYRSITQKAYAGNALIDKGVLAKTTPFFSAGITYKLNKSFFLMMDYTYNPSFTIKNGTTSPVSQVITTGIGYNF